VECSKQSCDMSVECPKQSCDMNENIPDGIVILHTGDPEIKFAPNDALPPNWL